MGVLSNSGLRVASYCRTGNESRLLEARREEAERRMRLMASKAQRGKLNVIQGMELYWLFRGASSQELR